MDAIQILNVIIPFVGFTLITVIYLFVRVLEQGKEITELKKKVSEL